MSAVPKPDFEIDLVKTIGQELGAAYQNIEFLARGLTRDVFIANYSPIPGVVEKRIIKVDVQAKSERSQRNVSKGLTTENDVRILLPLQNPEAHHLTKVYDYRVLQNDVSLSVEAYFPSQTLEERVHQSPLKVNEFIEIFSKVLEGDRYLINEAKLLHRDLKPSNILVGESNSVRITDFANAKKMDDILTQVDPTRCGHLVADPLTMKGEGKYTEQSEMYSLGADMFFALTGKYIAEALTAPSLRDEYGATPHENHDAVLDVALKALPRDARRYASIIKRCMTLDETKRYASINELANEFAQKSRPSIGTRIKRRWKQASAIAGLSLALGTAIVTGVYQHNKALEQRIIDGSKYKVKAMWNGGTLEVGNNLVELDVRAYSSEDYRGPSYPAQKYLRVKPGGKVDLSIVPREVPRDKGDRFASLGELKGQVYIEGRKGQFFWRYPLSHDPTPAFNDYPGYDASFYMTLPESLPEGTHILAVELYAPKQDPGFIAEPGKVIARKRIRLVVGDPKRGVDIESFMLGITNQAYFYNATGNLEDIDPSLRFEGRLLAAEYTIDLGGKSAMNAGGGGFWMPPGKPNQKDILQFTACRDGKPVYRTYLPVETEKWSDTFTEWKLAVPDNLFSTRIRGYDEAERFSNNPASGLEDK